MSSGDKQNQFINSALAEHNKYRQLHGVGNLKHNPELSKIALNWANYLVNKRQLQHSSNKYKNNHLGENLFYASGYGNVDYGIVSTKSWYDEVKNYNWNKPSFGSNTGHFTQVVWKNSTEFGLGVAMSNDGTVFVCANYYPAGNFNNAYTENVFKANGQLPETTSTDNSNAKYNNHNNDENENESDSAENFDWSEPKFNMSTGINQNFGQNFNFHMNTYPNNFQMSNGSNSFGADFPGFSGGSSNSRFVSKSTSIVNGKKVVTTKVVENGEETVTREEFDNC